jgi:hypothetical protein
MTKALLSRYGRMSERVKSLSPKTIRADQLFPAGETKRVSRKDEEGKNGTAWANGSSRNKGRWGLRNLAVFMKSPAEVNTNIRVKS